MNQNDKKGSHMLVEKNRAEARAEALFYLEAFSFRAVILINFFFWWRCH